jgi:histidine triad (HIT) family protein
MSDSIFTKIIKGEIPSYKVAENDLFYAFLDINPISIGHTLIVPKNQTDYFFDLNSSELEGILPFAKVIADKIQKVTNCERVGLSVIGFEVPHAHLHLIPMNSMSDMDFTSKKIKLSTEEFEHLAKNIQKV